MPTENEKPAAPPAAVPDPRDAEITKLKQQLSDVEKENAALAQDLDSARKELKKKGPAAPTGDYVVLRGKTYGIRRTVECKYAADEARRGHDVELESELVVLKPLA